MDNCIFCKIIKGDIPSYKLYEDEYTYAFMDIANDIDGHILVIPKKHVENILDCDNETLAEVVKTVKLVSQHYVNDCGYDGINIINANNKEAQQSVFHLHFHIIPRKENDKENAFPKFSGAKTSLQNNFENLKM